MDAADFTQELNQPALRIVRISENNEAATPLAISLLLARTIFEPQLSFIRQMCLCVVYSRRCFLRAFQLDDLLQVS